MFRVNTGQGRGSVDQGHAAPGERHPVCHRPRSRLGDRRAERARDLASRLGRRRAASTSATAASASSAIWLYFETPDCHLVALNMKDGKERWRQPICDLDLFYYASVGAGHREEPRDRRRQRRRSRRARLHPVARSEDRRAAVALVRRAAEDGRARLGDLAERRRDEARRRHDLAAGHLRSRAEPDLRRDRQPAAGHRARQSRRRQPLHRVDRRARRRHRQDGVVLPVVAARHARLGLDADAGALRRARSTASRAS